MAPPRRVRDEALTLRRTGLPDIELFRARESIYLSQYPTQNRFQVAPTAGAIAFSTPQKNELTVVRRDGTMASFENAYQPHFRISPDGQSVFVSRYYDSSYGISRIDVHTMQQASRTPLSSASWIEMCPDGLIALEYKFLPNGREISLVLLPWNGEPRTLARVPEGVARFACAKAGPNIAYFDHKQIWFLANPEATPIPSKALSHDIQNAEMSPDGRMLIVATEKEVYRFEDGKLVQTIELPKAHTVWFSRDGSQFVVANQSNAYWQCGEKTATFDGQGQGPIRTARFAPMSPWIMVARGADAVRWNPERNDSETIASADEGQEMLGADVFGGGVVLWTGSTWQLEDWRKRAD